MPKKGRAPAPKLLISEQHRRRCVELKASGLDHKAIAAVFGLPVSVLEQRFSVELENAMALAESTLLGIRW
jgi:hypothetical protein